MLIQAKQAIYKLGIFGATKNLRRSSSLCHKTLNIIIWFRCYRCRSIYDGYTIWSFNVRLSPHVKPYYFFAMGRKTMPEDRAQMTDDSRNKSK